MIEYTVLDRVEHHTCGMSLSDVAFMTPQIRWVHPSYFIFNQKKNKIKEPNAYEQLEVRNDYWKGEVEGVQFCVHASSIHLHQAKHATLGRSNIFTTGHAKKTFLRRGRRARAVRVQWQEWCRR
jgi:hypothetical protein